MSRKDFSVDERKILIPGKGHHFIPQKILRNFSFSEDGTDFCYKYNKGSNPAKDSVRNIAKRDKFYWEGKDKTADIHITNYAERRANEIIDEIINPSRKYDIKELLDNSAWLMNFMSYRTRSRRDRVSVEKRKYLERLIDSIGPGKISVDMMLSESMDVKARLITEEKSIEDKEREFSEYCSKMRQTAKGFDDLLLKEMINLLKEELEGTSTGEKGLQLDILREITTVDFSFEFFNNNYSILRRPPNSFILGDSAVVYSTFSGYRGTLVKSSAPPIWAALPISHDIALVATNEPMHPPSVEEINFASAEVSQHFFVAPIVSDNLKNLSMHIGDSPYMLSERDISKAIQGAREFFVQPIVGMFKLTST